MARWNQSELLAALGCYRQGIAGVEVWLSWSIGVGWRGCLGRVGSCGGDFGDELSGIRPMNDSAQEIGGTQFSTRRPGTWANSRVLLVTSVACWLRAWAAIMVSSEPIGVPRRSR